MANYINNNLDNNLKVYVEYTNEPWNYQFPQSQWLLEKAGGVFKQQPFEYATRAKSSLEKFISQFTDKERVVRVFNAQFWNTGYLTTAISSVPNLMESFDAIGLGYYIGHHIHGAFDDVADASEDEIIDYLIETAEKSLTRLNTYRDIADQYGVKMIAYEAGQHLVGGRDAELVSLYERVNKNPRMKDLYLTMATNWTSAGGELLVWFNSAWKVFGTLESQGQDLTQAPKYQAMKEIISQNGC
jgi:hypothetical protein